MGYVLPQFLLLKVLFSPLETPRLSWPCSHPPPNSVMHSHAQTFMVRPRSFDLLNSGMCFMPASLI